MIRWLFVLAMLCVAGCDLPPVGPPGNPPPAKAPQ